MFDRLFRIVDNRSTTGDHFYTNFDGLRAVAALMVMVMHVYTLPTMATGAPGVFLFFGLSGFLLYTGFLSIADLDSRRMIAYLVRRVFRILPLFAVFVISFAWIFNDWNLDQRFTWSMSHLLFLQGKIHLWTVRAEMIFYMVLPLVMVLLILIDTAVYRFLLLVGIAIVAMALFKDYFAMFFLGMAAVHARHWVTAGTARILTWTSLALILVMSNYVELTEPLRHFFGIRSRTLMYEYGHVFFPLCFLLVLGVSRYKSRFFSNRWLRLMGICGYGIYLWHVPVMIVLQQLELGFWAFQVSFYFFTIAWSVLTYWLVEKPGIDLGRQIARWVNSARPVLRIRPAWICLFLLALILGFRHGFADPKIFLRMEVRVTESSSVGAHLGANGEFDARQLKFFPLRAGEWQKVTLSWWDRPVDEIQIHFDGVAAMFEIRKVRIDFPFEKKNKLSFDKFDTAEPARIEWLDDELKTETGGINPVVLRYKDENLQPWLTATRLGRIMMVVYAFAFVCLVWLVDKIVVRKPMQQNNKTSTSLSGFS